MVSHTPAWILATDGILGLFTELKQIRTLRIIGMQYLNKWSLYDYENIKLSETNAKTSAGKVSNS